MVDTKNIIIIGKIGSGKSTLANVLSESEAFREDSSSVAEIWRTKDKEFEVDLQKGDKGIKYRVIDTVGLGGDTKLTKEKLLEKFEEEIGTYIDEGISQIFFVIDKKIDEKVLDKFFWLNEYLFDNKAIYYTTIVRSSFVDFRKKEKRQDDIEVLKTFFNDSKEGYKGMNKILEKEKVVHVNNDSLKLREKSRKNLLDYLKDLKNEAPYKTETIKWLDKNYPLENERKKITVLDISKRELKGRLSLKGFANLKRLNCSDNQLTSLDLSDCPNLIELKCNNNQLTNLNFLKSVGNLEKLETQDNKSLHPQSLKVLENLNKLERLNINNTNLVEEWECLLKNCRILCCNSEEIMKEFDKKGCLKNDEDGKKYYDLDQWRETDKQNSLTASVIPLERLYVIRSNIKKFVDKWGVKEGENRSELGKLEHPDEFSKQWWTITGLQWTNRAASVVGGSLVFVGQADTENLHSQLYTQIGGVIAITSPFVETITSYANDQVYEAKQKQWDEFVEDAKSMLNNYHELLGILGKIEINKIGEVNKALNDLREESKKFLDKYDKEKNGRKNGVIDIDELVNKEARNELNEDLSKENEEKTDSSQLGKIIKSIENLEKEVSNYRQLRQDFTQNEKEKEEQGTTQGFDLKDLERQLKKAESDYKKIKKQLDLKLSEDEKTELKSKLLTLEEKIDIIRKQLVRSKLVELEERLKNQFKDLASMKYWGSKISKGWKETKEHTKNFVSQTQEYLVSPAWYWEQWKKRNNQLLLEESILESDDCQERKSEDKKIIAESENNQANTIINLEENEQGKLIEIPPK